MKNKRRVPGLVSDRRPKTVPPKIEESRQSAICAEYSPAQEGELSPVDSDPKPGNEPASESSALQKGAIMSRSHARVLIVHHDFKLLELSAQTLKMLGFADVHLADNGIFVHKALLGNRYDIILLDLLMPGLNGTFAFAKIRLKGFCKETRRTLVIPSATYEVCGADSTRITPLSKNALHHIFVQNGFI